LILEPTQQHSSLESVLTWWTCELCELVEKEEANTHTNKVYPAHRFTVISVLTN